MTTIARMAMLCLFWFSAQVLAANDSHPRMWLSGSDVSRLRTWASDSNPLWQQGLKPLAERAKAEMDAGDVPRRDCGSTEYEAYPAEMYAELFAFMSLVENDAAARSDYASRARTLLMGIVQAALAGPASNRDVVCAETGSPDYPPYRSPRFFTEDSNRARWHGEAYPLVVDWIYPSLSTSDKQAIRTLFLRWAQEIVDSGYHHPTPVGLVNDPALLADKSQVRWAGNNYYTAHMRNLGMLALALDAADDPNNQLRNYLQNATGAWLYIFDHLTRTDAKGGLLPEGYEYSPQTNSYALQFLLALKTAGADTCGRHCKMSENPFWDDFLSSFYHGLSPASGSNANGQKVHYPAWYGDGENYQASDFISAFGAMGAYDYLSGNSTRLASVRWAQTHMVPGGAEGLIRRVSNPEDFRQSILYFMLFDPQAAAPSDPRTQLPTAWYAQGMNIMLVRTDWSSNAAWFNVGASWNLIDHQQAWAGSFEWYANGEWLTKARNGYPDIAEGIASSEFKNLLAIENNRPNRDDADWRIDLWRRGSQWNLLPSADPLWLGHSDQSAYTYVGVDTTNVYNSSAEGATDVAHASRALLWLKPDVLFVFDRAQSNSANRFKRWWLQLANPATINGQSASSRTANNQVLTVQSLLPTNAVLSAVNTNERHIENTAARGDTMRVRLRVDAPDNPQTVQFLHRLLVTNDRAEPTASTLVQSQDGSWSGATYGSTVVMFPRALNASPSALVYASNASRHLITGLQANSNYTLSNNNGTWSLQSGGSLRADAAGVLLYPAGAQPELSVSLSGSGTGVVSSDPAGILCGSTCRQSFSTGSVLTLSASAASGSSFNAWGGACASNGSNPVCRLTLNDSQNVSASFSTQGGGSLGAPKLLRTVPVTGGVQLYFQAPATGSVSSYQATCNASGQNTRTANGSSSPLLVDNLNAGIKWQCSIKAGNSSGLGTSSNALSAYAQGTGAAVVVNGARADYSLQQSGQQWVLSSAAQTLSVERSQRVQFDDLRLAFDTDGNAGKAYRLYQAAFDRIPDAGGLGFHLGVMEKYNLPLPRIADSFVQSAEFLQTYGSLDNAGFVRRLYLNVLHREPDSGGVAFWLDNLNRGAASRAEVLAGFSESAENIQGTAAALVNGISFVAYEP